MKNIVFCADGTWNGISPDADEPDDLPPSNVLKVFHVLAGDTAIESVRLRDEEEKRLADGDGAPVQVAKYIHGVGDSANPIMRVVGGVFGAGLIGRIVRGYTFLSRNFEPGDAIFIVGFSRGAYTARALAGLVSSVGLLDRNTFDLEGDHELAYTLGLSAWRRYREIAQQKTRDVSIQEAIGEMIEGLPGHARIPLRNGDLVAAPVHTVAVWDTVGALGIPSFGTEDGHAIDAFRFADDILSGNVAHGLHAVSIDEQRRAFLPTLWQGRDGVVQVLFAGAHADVGGGYPEPESGLSNIALQWMVQELGARGVRFRDDADQVATDLMAPIHEPWKKPPFLGLPTGARTWGDYPVANHPTVVERLRRLAAEFRPGPIVTTSGSTVLPAYLSAIDPQPPAP